MKPNITRDVLFVFLAGLVCLAAAGCTTHSSTKRVNSQPKAFSSFDLPSGRTEGAELAAGSLNFQNADLGPVLEIYQELSKRTVIRPSALPGVRISLRSQTPLSRVEALQLLDTALAENGIAMILSGDTAVKAVPAIQAPQEAPPEISQPWRSLPDSGSYMMRTVQLKKLRPSEVVPVIMPFAKTPNGVLPIDSRGQLILRDYSSNIRKMLKVIEELENNAPR